MWLINVSLLQQYQWGGAPAILNIIIMYVYKTWKRSTKPLSSLQQEGWKTFFYPLSSIPFCSTFFSRMAGVPSRLLG